MTFTVYSKPNCKYCDQAKALLKSLNLSYEERIIDIGQPKVDGKVYVTVQQLKEVVPTAASVPQILRDSVLIGGFTHLQQELKGTMHG